MAVFVSHSDETGVGDPKGKFLVSGYVAREDDWPFIASAWQAQVLDGPPKIPYLHMRQIRNQQWRNKHGISFPDSQDRVSMAVSILGGVELDSVASVIERSHIEAVFHNRFKRKKDVPVGIDEPDYPCFLAYAAHTVRLVWENHPDVEQVDFVVSRNGKITDRLKEFHEQIRLLLEPPLNGLVGELIPADPETRLPLQAADVLCWHMQRHYAGTMHGTDQERFDTLIHGLESYLHEWEKSDLEKLAASLFPD